MRLALLLLCAIAAHAQTSLTIGWVSDHGVCVPMGQGFATADTGLQRAGDCVASLDVAAAVRALNPDFIIATGDLSNVRGNRAETYNGLLVRTVTPITCPSPGAVTLNQTITGSSTAQTGVSVSGGPVAGGSGVAASQWVINCGQPNAEVIQVSTNDTTNPYTLTAKFYKNHSVGEPIVQNSQTITIDTAPSVDCGPGACKASMMLTGSEQTYTFGSTMSSIVCSAGTCTATITNSTVMAWKVGDEVSITGIDELTESPYTVSSAGSTTTILFPSAVTGTFNNTSSPGASLTVKRLVFINNTTPYVGLDEESLTAFEVVRITAATRTTFTATFAHPHAAGVIMRASDQTPYLDLIRQGKFLPVIGNHDVGCGTVDWCEGNTGSITASDAFREYWSSTAGGAWPLSTLTYHSKSYGTTPAGSPLVTFFAYATSGEFVPQDGNQQEDHFTPLINASTAKWKVGMAHFPIFTDTANPALNSLGVGTNPIPNYGWMVNPNIDVYLNGHVQFPEHVTARNQDSSATLHYLTMGSGGDSPITALNRGAVDNCADPDVNCTVVAGGTTAGGDLLLSSYVYGRIAITDTDFQVRYYNKNDWINPVDEFDLDLSKSASSPADPCTGMTKVCFTGVSIAKSNGGRK